MFRLIFKYIYRLMLVFVLWGLMSLSTIFQLHASLFCELMQSCKCFPHVSKIPTITYNRASIIIIKNAIILNIIHNIFNHRDTQDVICILVILKRADSHDITEILLKVTLNPTTQTLTLSGICI
jgi:hypothetical protein